MPSLRRWRGWLLLTAALTVMPACAARAPVTAPGPARYQEFIFPDVPPDLARGAADAARRHTAAWNVLQAGDLRAAERQFSAVLARRPEFFPAEAALGYASIARHDLRKAVERFDTALTAAPQYVPALVGRGQALLALGQDAEALAAFRAALAIDPGLADLRARVEVLEFRSVQSAISDAHRAVEQGRLDDARTAYERALAASPDAAFLYRELADVERRAGRPDAALARARRALQLDPADGASQLIVAEVLEAQGAWDEAVDAYQRAAALDAAPGIDARIEAVRNKAALARLPDAYREIPDAPKLTRGDLAALVGVRLERVLRYGRRRDGVLVTDARGHWAQPWIASVVRAGLMDVYANHTFQPAAAVRRIDLAQVVARVLGIVSAQDPSAARAWQNARRSFSDLGPGHLAYAAASAAVAAGVLQTADNNAFQPSRAVSGAEAVEAIGRLETIVSTARLGARGGAK